MTPGKDFSVSRDAVADPEVIAANSHAADAPGEPPAPISRPPMPQAAGSSSQGATYSAGQSSTSTAAVPQQSFGQQQVQHFLFVLGAADELSAKSLVVGNSGLVARHDIVAAPKSGKRRQVMSGG